MDGAELGGTGGWVIEEEVDGEWGKMLEAGNKSLAQELEAAKRVAAEIQGVPKGRAGCVRYE